MIASLNGKVLALESTSAIIDVSGVGYLVSLPATATSQLQVNSNVYLFTTLIVREDGFSLFGFLTSAEQRAFDLLRSVSGVGPKSALALLSALTVDEIIAAVSNDDDSLFKQVSGIGPKTAKLITVTLAGKLGAPSGHSNPGQGLNLAVVAEALTNMGWNERSAIEAVQESSRAIGPDASSNQLLKGALARLGSSKTSVGVNE